MMTVCSTSLNRSCSQSYYLITFPLPMRKYSKAPRKGTRMITNTHIIFSFPWNWFVSALIRAINGISSVNTTIMICHIPIAKNVIIVFVRVYQKIQFFPIYTSRLHFRVSVFESILNTSGSILTISGILRIYKKSLHLIFTRWQWLKVIERQLASCGFWLVLWQSWP